MHGFYGDASTASVIIFLIAGVIVTALFRAGKK